MFKREILKLEDLAPGMELRGSVLNVVDFGAFVDIGLKDTGLVHISQLANRYIKDPHDAVSVGDAVHVWVMEIDKERRRVSLTMIAPGTERKPEPRRKPEEKSKSEKPRRRRDQGRRDQGRGNKPDAAVKRPPRKRKPAAPPPKLSKAKKEGAAPLQTFGELAAFLQQKPDEEKTDEKK